MTQFGVLPDDPLAALAAEARPAPAGRPWVMAVMVSSIDGATATSGVSGGLGGAGDHAIFHAARAVADVILVGAATVRAERYRLPGTVAGHREARARVGREGAARVAVVSGSGQLPADLPLLGGGTADDARPLLVTSERSEVPPHVSGAMELWRAGDDVDLRGVVERMARDGATVVACEGGPSLLGRMVALDLIDEWLVTVAPAVAGGTSSRLVAGAPDGVRHLTLERVWVDGDGDLLTRYLHRP